MRVIPFSDGRETDEALGERLSLWLSREHPGRVERLPYDENPLVVLERIGACTYYVAGRYHAVLLGYLAGCRLWAIPYHRKVEDLSDEIGLGRRAVLRDVHLTPQSELDRIAASLLNGDPAFHATRPRAEAFESARGNLIAVGSH